MAGRSSVQISKDGQLTLFVKNSNNIILSKQRLRSSYQSKNSKAEDYPVNSKTETTMKGQRLSRMLKPTRVSKMLSRK